MATRGERRKRETRRRLVDAAFRLMAERGIDAVAINEITEAADVGLGSFYNHFESKEAIYGAVMDELFEGFADALDRLLSGIEDPAEVISVSVRHTVRRARREPLWGRCLLREGFSPRGLTRGLGARLLRDIRKGMASRRFKLDDPLMTFIGVGGTVLGAISLELNSVDSPDLRIDTHDIAERAAALVLHTLGLSREQARRVAHRPLPLAAPQ